MCGICGIHRFGEAPIQQDMVDLLILNNQNRGIEAAGVALQQADGSIAVHKADMTPYQFIESREYKDFMKARLLEDTVTVIGHVRKVTKGSPRINNNNHPMFAGMTAVVHNGQFHDEDRWFNEWKLDRKAETDSDILRAVFDKEGFTRKAVNQLTKLSGNAAFAAIHPDYPGELLLARSGNPLELAATQDFLLFSSEKGPLYKAMRPFKQVFGIMMREMTPVNYYMIGMADDSAWLFADKPIHGERTLAGDWLKWHQEMRIAVSYNPPIYACHAQYHGNRVRFYDDRPIDLVVCPKCANYLHVSKLQLADLKSYTCGACEAPLA